jgi:hypothetical protein
LQQVLGRELIPMKDTLTKLFKSEQTSNWCVVRKTNFISFFFLSCSIYL